MLGFGLRQILNYIRGGYREIEPSSETALQELGILRPAEERTGEPLKTAVNKGRLLVISILAFVAVALIYFGDGEFWTWVGSVAFILLLLIFTWISIRPSADPMPD